jgi:IS30 family transposase
MLRCVYYLRKKILTITADNGKEFAYHKKISKNLNAKVYFTHAYHSWERGINENTNKLIRQYFPIKMPFLDIRNDEIQIAENKLNDRPRKLLKYKTPNEVFYKYQNK